MKKKIIVISESQLKKILDKSVEVNEEEETPPETTDTTTTTGTEKKGYPEVGKWETGLNRGAGNQIAITKWSDTVGANLKRGHANPLK